jgi:hypothetical protein
VFAAPAIKPVLDTYRIVTGIPDLGEYDHTLARAMCKGIETTFESAPQLIIACIAILQSDSIEPTIIVSALVSTVMLAWGVSSVNWALDTGKERRESTPTLFGFCSSRWQRLAMFAAALAYACSLVLTWSCAAKVGLLHYLLASGGSQVAIFFASKAAFREFDELNVTPHAVASRCMRLGMSAVIRLMTCLCCLILGPVTILRLPSFCGARSWWALQIAQLVQNVIFATLIRGDAGLANTLIPAKLL